MRAFSPQCPCPGGIVVSDGKRRPNLFHFCSRDKFRISLPLPRSVCSFCCHGRLLNVCIIMIVFQLCQLPWCTLPLKGRIKIFQINLTSGSSMNVQRGDGELCPALVLMKVFSQPRSSGVGGECSCPSPGVDPRPRLRLRRRGQGSLL